MRAIKGNWQHEKAKDKVERNVKNKRLEKTTKTERGEREQIKRRGGASAQHTWKLNILVGEKYELISNAHKVRQEKYSRDFLT